MRGLMSTLAEELGHLKHHVEYPSSKKDVVAACNNMSEAPDADSAWFAETLPEGTYKSADEVVAALLRKV